MYTIALRKGAAAARDAQELRTIRRWMIFFIIGLFLSGLTAMPIEAELTWLVQWLPTGSHIQNFIATVLAAYTKVKNESLFLLYGYDWLAFAHYMLAILFIGPLRNPVKNIWVIEFGLIACAAVIPFALVAGQVRDIPLGWRLIDCSFGVVGSIPLAICYFKIKNLK